MNTKELREKYVQFFEERGHRRIPSAPLLPENDPTVLFTTAGMHPLVPFLLGEPHPLGKRLVNFQKCIRTNDIDEVGDPSHLTFFEMLGNWSLGDYFKSESLRWSHEFLTSELGIDPERLAVTVFAGDTDAPRDDESAAIWRSLGIPDGRIFFLPKEDNWWGPAGLTGPCGPDSEIFFDTGLPDHTGCRPGCSCGKWVEIWNNVFMEYEKTPGGEYTRLRQRNVDTGMGVERTVMVMQGWVDIFQIDTLLPLIETIERLSGKRYGDQPVPFRVIVDHMRAATFAIGDGVRPANVQAGYVVRRLIRRAVRYGRELGIQGGFCGELGTAVVDLFSDIYPNLAVNKEKIIGALETEEANFQNTLERGLRQYERLSSDLKRKNEAVISGEDAFNLFQSYGFPFEMTREMAKEDGMMVDQDGFAAAYKRHREQSRDQSEAVYKGGLADQSVLTTRLHTATHLMHQALRQVLGPEVRQMGSNINPERLRFDFKYPQRLTDEQMSAVETIVNEQIQRDLRVEMSIRPLDQALKEGALAFFAEKYGERVKIYTIGDFSKEVCGGPHVSRTGELGKFRLIKQEAVGQGVRRLKAILEEGG